MRSHMNLQSSLTKKSTFLWLWLFCILGSLSLFPYLQHLDALSPDVSLLKLFFVGAIQAAIVFGVICWLSYKILPMTDLHPFIFKNFWSQIVYPALIYGLLVGFSIYFFDKWLFHSSLISGKHPPLWTGLLASLYGGVNEEVLCRLFLFTTIYFLCGKVVDLKNDNKKICILWTTNILVALIFGIGHLPAAFKLVSPTVFEIFRILLLNGIAGLTFGWLYWTRGLWTAIGAHCVADLVIHVFLT